MPEACKQIKKSDQDIKENESRLLPLRIGETLEDFKLTEVEDL